MMQTLPQRYPWTRDEYDRLAELGIFEGKSVELIGGQIVTMSPKGPRHEALTELVRIALAAAFAAERAYVRKEGPLALGDFDEPEPDIAVVAGQPRDYLAAHPTVTRTLLVVEVAETTRAYDLGDKTDLYAAAGITDYWVVCPADEEVIVCRGRAADRRSKTGWRFTERQSYRRDAAIRPLTGTALAVVAADLLP